MASYKKVATTQPLNARLLPFCFWTVLPKYPGSLRIKCWYRIPLYTRTAMVRSRTMTQRLHESNDSLQIAAQFCTHWSRRYLPVCIKTPNLPPIRKTCHLDPISNVTFLQRVTFKFLYYLSLAKRPNLGV